MPDNVISSSFSFLKARQGTSAFVVNLDNEMTSIIVDEYGNTMNDIELSPLLSAFYGSQNVISNCTVNVSCDDPDMTAEYNTTTHCVDISIQEETHLSQVTTITISVVHSSYGTRTITFTITAVPKGEGAFIQELLPSINEVSFARTPSGSLTPPSRSISLSIKRTYGNTTSSESISSSGLTVRWSTSAVPSTSSDGTGWGSGTSVSGITWSGGSMVVANSVSISNIYIAAFNSEGTLVDRETIPVIKDGANGTSPYFADLNNEMDAIQCKHDGSVMSNQTVSTVISMWKGSSVEAFVIDNIYRNGIQLTWDSNNSGVWPRISGNTVSIEFDTYASISNIDDFKITIHSYNDNTVTRELHFTINGVRANAIYRLIPSHSQIVKKKDGTYVPSGNVTCSVEKTENGSTSTPDASEYTLEKSVNGGSYTTYSATSASSITSDLKFRLKVGGVVVDLETIPLVSDGNKGDKGDLISFTNTLTSIVIECDSNGFSLATRTKPGLITLYVNGSQLPPITLTTVSKPTSLTVTTSASGIPVGGFAVSWSSGVNMDNLQGTIVLRASSTGYSADISIPVMCTKSGERGKTGRFYYFADTFNKDNNTDTYSATDSEAPFFFYNNNYWVWKGDNFANKTMKWLYYNKGGYPSSDNNNYEIMVTDFKYLITEAIFGKYAHFGSAIINGDWMISQHGTYGGNTPIDYTKFDPAYPSTSVYTNHTVNGTTWLGYNFVPNYAVDLLTGKTYMTSAEVRGTIRADNLYHGITFASRAWDGGNVYTSYKWYCMPASIYGPDGYDAKETQQPYYNNFSPYNYYTEEEIATLSGGALTVPQNHGFLMCVGDNDNVYVLPDSYNRFPTIYLPAPEDVQGKVVDVFGFNYGTPSSIPNFEVKNVGNPNSGMTPLIYYDASENKWKAVQSSGTARITVATNAAMRFISTGVTVGSTTTWWWLAVPFYQKEWVQS